MGNVFIGIVAPGAVLAPVAIAVYKTRYLARSERFFLLYLLFCGCFNLLAKLTAHHNNLPLLHLYTVLEFCLLCACFRILFTGHGIRKLLSVLMICFPVFALLYVGYTHTLFVYNDVPRFVSSILLTLLCIYYLLDDLGRDFLSGYPFSKFNFIAVVALLVYYSSCSALFGLSNYLMVRNHDMKIDTIIWGIHAGFMMLMYLVFAAAYAIIKKQ